jgi:SNF2 family DNA or RNA helicase
VGLTFLAGGTGLTLTHAWAALFVDLDWVPANNVQAEDRLARIGQRASKVEIIRLVSDHALDRRVLQVVDRKMELIQKAVESSTGPAESVAA